MSLSLTDATHPFSEPPAEANTVHSRLTPSRAAPATLDVVVVPDFSGPQAHIQEGQLLFFLASWLERQDAAPTLSLRLACIGEPPQSVRRLAELSGARISRHDPIGIRPGHHVGNKLRGLEVESDADGLLLLDADTLLLGDVRHLAEWSDGLAAAPDDNPKLTSTQWDHIRRGLAMERPVEPIACLAAELNLPASPARWLGYKVPLDHDRMALPYFNSGALVVPRGCGLRTLWEQNITRIAELFPSQPHELERVHRGRGGGIFRATPRNFQPRELKWVHRSDQAGLAVSVQALREEGWRFRRLPAGINARWRNLYAGTPDWDSLRALHLTTFLHGLPSGMGGLTSEQLLRAARRYLHGKLTRRFARLMLAEAWHGNAAAAVGRFQNARRQCRRLDSYLERLVVRHIRSALS